ncbi:hypothetical protein BALOs_2935 [Halobacteriovorax sp. BALOs_7]|uniref:hypothetical protein n=1 Tax=Halobacteriovorax sp. BALOs_7 TaxID=2109558 RepID=UPI000EA270A6|nr:hypothetical protein [Halobacteriovorax sp. BALOs_7]AYF45918.1 hypothetical protein BALOs_2935 [Halobacteriovorax sp. BALOs_7]
MKNKFFILVLVFLSLNSHATYDLHAGAGFRSYALGAAARIEGGANQELWRHNDQIYGFLREAAYFTTSGTINTIGGKIEFFPISILGFVAGSEQVYRSSKELDTFDCDVQVCDSDGTRSYLRVDSVLGYKKFVMINDYQRDYFDYDFKGEVANALHTLEIQSDDIVNIMRNIIAYQYSDKYTFGIIHFRTWSEKTKQDKTFVGFLNQFKKDKWTYDVVLGGNRDRFNRNHFSMLLQLKYDYKKGLRLF